MSFEDPHHNFDALMQKIEERAAARQPDGHFAEFCGKVAFSVVERVVPTALSTAPGAVETAMQRTPFGTPNAVCYVTAQTLDSSSLFNRALIACLDKPEAPESVQTFMQLSGYVQALPVTITNKQPVEHRIWAQKTAMLVRAYELAKQKEHFEQRAFGESTATTEIQMFTDTLVGHVGQIKEAILATSGTDILAAIQLLDASKTLDDALVAFMKLRPGKGKIFPKLRNLPQGLYDVMSEAQSYASAEGAMDLMYLNIEQTVGKKWEQFQTGWTWQNINQVLDVFTTLESQNTRFMIIDALEDALESSPGGTIPVQELNTQSLAGLIHSDIYSNVKASPFLPIAVIDKIGKASEVTFGDVTLPSEMTPTTAVALLTEIGTQLSTEDFAVVLERMQETICGKHSPVPTTTNEWLLTLALLRQCPNDTVRMQTDAFIARAGFPNAAFQQIITGQKQGNVYLLPGGKIRVDTNLAKGWALAKSSFTAPIDQTKPTAPSPSPASSSYEGPDKGPLVTPGKELTRRQRKKAKTQPEQLAEPLETTPPPERPAPVIVLPPDQSLQSLGQEISPTDLAIVARAIDENQQYGRHRLVALRHRTGNGSLLCKMRINGKDDGIRVILAHTGGNLFEIQTIQYRGRVHKDTLFK